MSDSTDSPWFSLAAHSLEGYERATVVLDGTGAIRLVNRAAETLLGRPREQLIASSFAALIPPEDVATAKRLVQELLAGPRTTATLETTVRPGARVAIVIARVPSSTLLFTLELRHLPSHAEEPPPEAVVDEQLEIHLAPERRFEIKGGAGAAAIAGKTCHLTLFGRDRPCSQCPVHGLRPDERERATVLRANGSYHVLRVSRTGDETALVWRQIVEEELCRQLVGARLDTLADQGGLSPQERNVLELLALGRSHGDIAEVLGITERTVRFHQGNLLAKMGAESRADLLRLLL